MNIFAGKALEYLLRWTDQLNFFQQFLWVGLQEIPD